MKPETNLKTTPVAANKPANIITIASGKGGVGKTWFAITLTHALAKRNSRVLLFDGDIGLANVDIQLGLMPPKDLGNVISGKSTLRESAIRYEEGGFDIIAGRSGSGNMTDMPGQKLDSIHEGLRTLSMDYDQLIIDLGAGIESAVQKLTDSTGTILVLTTDEPTALTDAYAFIKITTRNAPKSDIRVVVNMADTLQSGEKTYNTLLKACQNFLKISPPLAGIIRRDIKVRESIRHQSPILQRYPNSPAAQCVEEIAAQLTG
ncbi:MAG: MinD/ParA family protein [Rhodospirillaceae bacterium]|nr:MinD/ParA family protein [Rhodospirillaceae bacterium]MBT5659395.1 MinD/ParA family protein [Rhodospirillaceae bacterium]MBT5753059.1 MinD/ParA family protein [Rhodospirillaceae bacterium]